MLFSGLYIDPVYLWVLLLTLLVSVSAQVFVTSQYRKWGGVRNGPDLSGTEIGYAIVNRTHLGGGQWPKEMPLAFAPSWLTY